MERKGRGAALRTRSPAQWYCILAGGGLALGGLFGFIADASFDTGTAPDGTLQGSSFLGFEVNGWHNVVHLGTGLLLLAAANTAITARAIAFAFGVVYALVAVIGLIDGEDVLGVLPVNPADNLLHLALAALGVIAAVGLRRPRRAAEPAQPRLDERPASAAPGRSSARSRR